MKKTSDVKVNESLEESEMDYRKAEADVVVPVNISEINHEYRLKKTPKQIKLRKKTAQQKKSRKLNRKN